MKTLISTSKLSIEIADKQVCQNLELNIREGESWAILGMNGVGKTTLLHTLAGLRPPQSGSIYIGEQDIRLLSRREIARHLGLLLQDYEDAFPGTVLQTVLCGRHPHLSNWQWESEEDIKIARQSLSFVDMSGFESRSILKLSGGERRRVAIASLLCQQTPLLLLDEPSNHLDLRYQHRILNGLRQQSQEQNQALVMIMHDVNLASRYCDHALLLYEDGSHLSGRCSDVIKTDNLSRLYAYPMRSLEENGEPFFIPV